MNKVYEDSKRMLEREVQEIANRGPVSIEDISMMYDSDASYARGRGSQANRDSMGRYSGRGYNYGSYDGGSYRGSYDGYDMRR